MKTYLYGRGRVQRGVAFGLALFLCSGGAYAQTETEPGGEDDSLAFLEELSGDDAPPAEIQVAQAEPASEAAPAPASSEDLAALPAEEAPAPESDPAAAGGAAQAAPQKQGSTPIARRKTLDEVIVTAQKRAEDVQDVPLSVTAIGAEDIKMKNMGDLNYMAIYVPNVKLLATPTYSFVYIRGAGTGLNKGFEQSVATIIDGVYYARMGYMTGAQIDLAAFEVLRGPQGTLYGKNTVAGAMHIKTGDPDPEWGMDFQGLTDDYTDKARIRGMIKGPLWGDDLSFRIAYGVNIADGFVHNTTLDRNEANTNRKNIRAKIRYTGIPNLDMILTADLGTVSQHGQGAQLSFLMPEHEPLFQAYDPTTEDDLFNHQSALDGAGYADRDVASGIFKATYEMGDYTWTAISGYSWNDEDIFTDVDFSAVPLITSQSDEEYKQFSQELRVASPLDQSFFGGVKFDYVAGLYFFWNDIYAVSDIPWVVIDEFTVDTVRATIPAALDGLVDQTAIDAMINVLDNSIEGQTGGATERIIGFHKQKAKSFSVFGQANFHMTSKLDLILGARIDHEIKEAHRKLELTNTKQIWPALVEGVEEHESQGTRRETSISPKVTMKYDYSEEIMLYGLIAKGFKGGGFNANAVNPSEFTFEEENSITFEGGFKTRWLGGAMTFNANYYYTKFKNLQASVYNGQKFVVENAETATTQGFEVELALIPLEGLILTANFGTIDAKYGIFTQGPCSAEGEDFPCDLSGKPFADAPENSGTIGFIYDTPLGNTGVFLMASGEYFRQGPVWFQADLDPKDYRDAVNAVGLRLGLHNEDASWAFTVYCNNCLDEQWSVGTADVPVFAGSHFGGAAPQRNFEAEFRFSL